MLQQPVFLFIFQALGSGDLSSYGNELTEAPEEEEDFDVLNDETFGDIGDGKSGQHVTV